MIKGPFLLKILLIHNLSLESQKGQKALSIKRLFELRRLPVFKFCV